jgi:molybdopterin-guanine dinucleotide biosynthesis protein A
VSVPVPHEVGGYILAGGKSSRMGRDKALMELAGKPLIRHAVKKLRRVCMDVRILTNSEELEAFAPIVRDIHPGCGPMSGMEAGLRHSIFEWNLFMAVDVPFVPSAFVFRWVKNCLSKESHEHIGGGRVWMFKVDGRAQPGFCLLHKDVTQFLTAAIERGEYKLLPVLQAAGRELAERDGFPSGRGFHCVPFTGFRSTRGRGRHEDWMYTTEAQQRAQSLWFANLNTPEEFAEAERHVDALDT